jgi:hypothetical protein
MDFPVPGASPAALVFGNLEAFLGEQLQHWPPPTRRRPSMPTMTTTPTASELGLMRARLLELVTAEEEGEVRRVTAHYAPRMARVEEGLARSVAAAASSIIPG